MEEVPPLRHHVVVALVVHARVPNLHMEVWPHKHVPRGQVVVDKAMLSEETLQVSRNGHCVDNNIILIIMGLKHDNDTISPLSLPLSHHSLCHLDCDPHEVMGNVSVVRLILNDASSLPQVPATRQD